MKQLKTKMIAVIVMILTIGIPIFAAGNLTNEQNKFNSDAIMKNLKDKRVLVVYFSRAGDNYKVGYIKKGNTKFIAEYIAEMTNGNIFEIIPKKNYDLSYEQMLGIVREESKNQELPEFNGKVDNISQYDVVFVGGPIWWGTYPRVMFTFLNEYDVNGKILIPFTTNEGSGLGDTKTALQEMYPEAVVLDGFTMTGHEAREPEARQVVEKWLAQLEYKGIKPTDETHKIDSITNGTKENESLTLKGKEYEKQKQMILKVEFQDGHQENIDLVVQGAVEMGCGTLWGATNLGSAMPWEVGDHYAWGETEPKESYTEENYKYFRLGIGSDINKTWYNAAQTNLGGDWRMPTKDEWDKLLYTTQHEWVTIEGKQGYLFTAKSGARLFFPANGYIYDQEVGTPDEGYYWTATISNIDNAYVSYLPSNSWGISNYGRHIGLGIRPVK